MQWIVGSSSCFPSFSLFLKGPKRCRVHFSKVSSGPAASTRAPAWEVPRVTSPPSAPPGGRLAMGGCLTPRLASAAPQSQGAGSGEVPAAGLAWYPGHSSSPCSLHAGTYLRLPTVCRGVFWAVPGSHTWLHSCESSHYGCSAPAADLEPQCGPRVSSCCFWKAPGRPSRSVQAPKWLPAPTLPAASQALLLFLKNTGVFLPQGLCTCHSLC